MTTAIPSAIRTYFGPVLTAFDLNHLGEEYFLARCSYEVLSQEPMDGTLCLTIFVDDLDEPPGNYPNVTCIKNNIPESDGEIDDEEEDFEDGDSVHVFDNDEELQREGIYIVNAYDGTTNLTSAFYFYLDILQDVPEEIREEIWQWARRAPREAGGQWFTDEFLLTDETLA